MTLRRNGVGAATVLRMLTVNRGATVIDGKRLTGPSQPGWIMWQAREIFAGAYDLPGFEIRSGDVVVDVGANIGLFTLLAVHRGAGAVSAYEPHPQTARWLVDNTAGLPVMVHRAAVTAAGGTASLWLSSGSATRHSTAVQQTEEDTDAPALEVPAVALVEAIDEGCDVLKLDCEGEEFRLVQATPPGALRRIRTIVGELHEYAGDADQMRLTLERAGFDFLRYPGQAPGLSVFLARRN